MKARQQELVLVFSAVVGIASAGLNPPVRTDADRNATPLKVDMERVGTLCQKGHGLPFPIDSRHCTTFRLYRVLSAH